MTLDPTPDHPSLPRLFIDELRDLYHAERQLVRILPAIGQAASSICLQAVLDMHLEETRGHVTRLERVFDMLERPARPRASVGMAGLVAQAANLIHAEPRSSALDAAIIACSQRIDHYEIAAYRSLIGWARLLGQADIAVLLAETLAEEKASDGRLGDLASASTGAASGEAAGLRQGATGAAWATAAAN
jgi:ferritin-like metal-binding protein YciE